jgi:hypothetical protein
MPRSPGAAEHEERPMSDNVLIIPTTHRVGGDMPAYLPLRDGSLKPVTECRREDVAQAAEELRALARSSREKLQQAYEEHLRDIRMLAQTSAYLANFDAWSSVREGGQIREFLWNLEPL